MSFLKILAVGAVLALISCAAAPATPEGAGQGEPPAQPLKWEDLLSRPAPTPTEVFTTTDGGRPLADLWLPDSIGPHPLVIMVHGGCWRKSIADRTIMNWAADALRRDGFAVWNIEYRGVDEGGGGDPGTYPDVARAADAVNEIAHDRNIKLDHVVAFGHSAGGHLALWLAARPRIARSSPLYTANPLRLHAVVNVGGLADLQRSKDEAPASCLAEVLPLLTGAPSATRTDVFSDTNPAALLPLGVRLANVNGTLDRIAPATLGEDLARRARTAGDDAEFVGVAGAGHVDLVAPGTPAFDRERAILRRLSAQ